MSPKRASGVVVASASPAPVDPKAASPFHSACNSRADHHGGLTHAAVNDILRDLGFAARFKHFGSANRFRATYLDHVAEKSGVPFLSRLRGRGHRSGDEARPLRFEHVLYLVWELVAHAMDNHEVSSTAVEDTAVVTTARSLVVAAIAAENLAYTDTFGEHTDVEDCVEKVLAIVDMSLGGAPVDELSVRELMSVVVPDLHAIALRRLHVVLLEGRDGAGWVQRRARLATPSVPRRA